MTVKEARINKGLTQVQLAAKAGVSLLTLAKIERGDIEKTAVGNVLKICNALDFDASSLFCAK